MRPAIDQMRGEQHEKLQAGDPFSGDQPDLLEHTVMDRVGNDSLLDGKTILGASIGDGEEGNAVRDAPGYCNRVALFLGEKAAWHAVRHDQAAIARAGLVDAGIIDFVENAVAM